MCFADYYSYSKTKNEIIAQQATSTSAITFPGLDKSVEEMWGEEPYKDGEEAS